MHARVAVGVVSGLLALSVIGCGAPREAAPRAAVVPATGVCTGVQKCAVVADTDVDGDGVQDQVGFVVESKKRVVVRVKTATGHLLHRELSVLWFPRGEFYGAADVDGAPGSELVLGTTMGAHTMWFTTLTVRSGRLVRLPAPDGEQEWMIDGAYSFHAGVTRRVEHGQAVVVLQDAARQGLRPRFTGRDRVYVWRAGDWQHRSTARTHYRGEDSVAPVGGWHVRGLPRMPAF